jgi:DNA modification methylase
MELKIIYRNIDDLKAYENNPRENEQAVDAVAESIREFGFKVPIVVDKNNVIVAGHTRLKAAQKLGLKEVPVIVASDLTDEQIKAFRLADNKTAELADWDFTKLEEELNDIDMDMSVFGFEDDQEQKEAVDDDFDLSDAMDDEPQMTKPGDVYILGKHRLMCGDSTKSDDVKKLLDGVTVDIIFTDPPYNVDYEGTAGKIMNDKMEDGTFYKFLFSAFQNMFEAIKEGGSIYVCHADTEGLNFRNAFKQAGFKLSECLVWVKNALVLGRQDYHWRHEPILYGWKEGSAHYFIDDRTQDTVLEYDKPRRSDEHPTMKPLELVGKCIANSSKKGDKVLDLFGGSGSTLIASDAIDRICFMMELDPKYCDVIVKRYLKAKDENKDACYLIRESIKTKL